MIVIEQKLVVKDWPLIDIGDSKFFGYVVGIGLFPDDDNQEFPYADFSYNGSYTRYKLPWNDNLIGDLQCWLSGNISEIDCTGLSYGGKVWIEKLADGQWGIDLP